MQRESMQREETLALRVAGEDPATCTDALVLRRFLRHHSQQLDAEYKRHAGDQLKSVREDVIRFIIMCVCWLHFLCEVIRLAKTGEPHKMTEYITALLSPALFCYVLDKTKEPLCWRSIVAGVVAFLLFLNCVHRRL